MRAVFLVLVCTIGIHCYKGNNPVDSDDNPSLHSHYLGMKKGINPHLT